MNPGAARVLELLRREAGPFSGKDLSGTLRVSRTQIWKHVETLRGLGYEITGEPGGGYSLAAVPDRLYPEEIRVGLATRWLAREVHWLEETASTNDVAHALAREGAAHGTVVIAEGQTRGRGRHGRSFFSPPFRNLYTSMVLRPPIHVSQAPTVVLAAAVAVADAVARTAGDEDAVQIKWPNDVLLGGRKTCGILMEMTSEATRVAYLVLGIGVNLNLEREAFPAEFRATATSLQAHRGRPVDRAAFARLLFGTLEPVLDLHASGGFEAVRPRFEARFRMAGRAVCVRDVGGPEIRGEAEGIDRDGALVVRRPDGRRERVLAGDVTLQPGVPGGAT